jgi:transposase
MRIHRCDLHAAQQTIAMLDCDTAERIERTLKHEGSVVRDLYGNLVPPVVVGTEATGSMGWFLRLMEELGIACHVGHPAKIRSIETRRQKHDRRDAALLLELLTEDRFPSMWMPSAELADVRALLLHRDQWVRMRTRVKNALQGLALAHGLRRRAGLLNRHRRGAEPGTRHFRRLTWSNRRGNAATAQTTSKVQNKPSVDTQIRI